MLEINITYNSHNSVLLPFSFLKCRYVRDLIGGQKINVTFGGPLFSEFYGRLCKQLTTGHLSNSLTGLDRGSRHFVVLRETHWDRGVNPWDHAQSTKLW